MLRDMSNIKYTHTHPHFTVLITDIGEITQKNLLMGCFYFFTHKMIIWSSTLITFISTDKIKQALIKNTHTHMYSGNKPLLCFPLLSHKMLIQEKEFDWQANGSASVEILRSVVVFVARMKQFYTHRSYLLKCFALSGN